MLPHIESFTGSVAMGDRTNDKAQTGRHHPLWDAELYGRPGMMLVWFPATPADWRYLLATIGTARGENLKTHAISDG